MPNNKWDDEQIENLLRDFPAIRDERPKEEVYNRLVKAEQPERKQPKRWLPYLVAALAFITFGVLITSLLSQSSSDSAEYSGAHEESANQSTAVENNSAGEAAESESSEDSAEFSIMQLEEPASTSIYPEDLEGFTLFTIGLTENANTVPVSFLIPNEQIKEEFGEENPDSVGLYNRYAEELDEEALGFDDYHPYEGTLEKTAEGVSHTLPEGHSYDLASASIGVYTQTMQETFEGEGDIAVLDETGQPAEFSQVGPMEPFAAMTQHIPFFAYTAAAGETYLTPGYGMPYDSAAEAIEAMKTAPNDFYQTLIPENIAFEVNETADLVEIDFQEPVDFEALDEKTLEQMIEGLALSVDSFDKNLKFTNIGTDQWGRFDFTGVIEAPEAINRLDWNIK